MWNNNAATVSYQSNFFSFFFVPLKIKICEIKNHSLTTSGFRSSFVRQYSSKSFCNPGELIERWWMSKLTASGVSIEHNLMSVDWLKWLVIDGVLIRRVRWAARTSSNFFLSLICVSNHPKWAEEEFRLNFSLGNVVNRLWRFWDESGGLDERPVEWGTRD